MLRALRLPILALALSSSACTVHHSRQALEPGLPNASPDAVFVSEEDSGLGIFLGLFIINEPDHYAVLMERMRRRYRCGRIHHAELEYRTDHWILIAFPHARLTAICEPPQEETAGADAPDTAAPLPQPSPPAPAIRPAPDAGVSADAGARG